MHAFIWATEVYVLGYNEAQAGKGNGKTDMAQYISWTQNAGSSYMKFWNGNENLNYYLDYQFPLGKDGWGSTSDQQALSDGEAINIHLITGSAAEGSNYAFFQDASGQKDKTKITQGEAVTLTLYRTESVYGKETDKVLLPNTDVYYISADAYYGQKLTENTGIDGANWVKAGSTNAEGKITLPSDLQPGTYYVSSMGVDGGYQITPAAFVLKVTKSLGNVILGDVNGDEAVDSVDAVLVLKKHAQTLTQSEFDNLAADVNDDGAVDSVDAVLILKRHAGLIPSFPAE